jgi:hypothetical protein
MRTFSPYHRGPGYHVNIVTLSTGWLRNSVLTCYHVVYPPSPVHFLRRGVTALIDHDFDDLGWTTESPTLHAGLHPRPSPEMLPPRLPRARLWWKSPRTSRWEHGDWTAADLMGFIRRNNRRPGNHIRYYVEETTERAR